MRQEYTLPSVGTGKLAPTFNSGTNSVQGWLRIVRITIISFVIIDFESGVIIVGVIVIISAKQASYDLYVSKKQYTLYYFYEIFFLMKYYLIINVKVLSSPSFLESSKGLLIDGCPNNEILPWEETKFSPRLRKRQSSDCLEMAKQYAELFPNSDAFSFENVLKMCESNSKKAASSTPDDVQRETLESLRIANEYYNKYFSGEKKPLSAQEFKEI